MARPESVLVCPVDRSFDCARFVSTTTSKKEDESHAEPSKFKEERSLSLSLSRLRSFLIWGDGKQETSSPRLRGRGHGAKLMVPVMLTLGSILVTTSLATAQSVTKRTYHVYVDPIYGDDFMATQLNPSITASRNSKKPLGGYVPRFPDPLSFPNNGSGVLQHAANSFRTMTGSNGAVAYANSVLGWTGVGGKDKIEWVVIHCLPGLYGPDSTIDPALSDFDTESGFRFNGESFPVTLKQGVSVQGTSALDTIFDARMSETAIFVTGSHATGSNPTVPIDYFIDSLTIRNARSDEGPPGTTSFNTTGAGIWVGGEGDVPLTISNCFITDNDVGIAAQGDIDPLLRFTILVVNNTIAWNVVGVWNGDVLPLQPNDGHTEVILLNNIFDTRRPTDANQTLREAFQGIHDADVTTTTPSVTFSFNAWDPAQTNNAITKVSNFPFPGVRTTPVPLPLPAPRVDLAPFMGTGVIPRGILYVNDALRFVSSNPLGLSRHDFRLAPHVGLGPINPLVPLTLLNPMVNQGVDIGHPEDPSSLRPAIVFLNGSAISDHPGIHAPDVDLFNAWDWDTEGFGNPRIRTRVGFPSFPGTVGAPLFGNIDFGADEMDELIMAGYIPNTRLYGNGPLYDASQASVYFFDLRGAVHLRPDFSGQAGLQFNWWNHTRLVTAASDAVAVNAGALPTNYTDATMAPPGGATPAFRGGLTSGLNPLLTIPIPSNASGDYTAEPPIMRNLECDFSPSLLADAHHLWGQVWFSPLSARPSDVYAANPWYGEPVVHDWLGSPFTHENWFLYTTTTVGNPSFVSSITDGTINPPGSARTTPVAETGPHPSYLLPGSITNTFGPYSPCVGSSPTTYMVGNLGFGDSAAGCPDMLPLLAPWLGIRYNNQVMATPSDPQTSNLQTFLVVLGEVFADVSPAGSQARAASRSSKTVVYPGPRSTLEKGLPKQLFRRGALLK